MRLLSVLLLALALTATAAPLPFPKEVRNPALKKLQGKWAVSRIAMADNPLDWGDEGKSLAVMEFELDHLTIRHGRLVVAEWRISLLAGEREGRIELKQTGRVKGGEDGRAIYRLSGDSLFLIFARSPTDPLPATFDPDSGRGLIYLRRKAP